MPIGVPEVLGIRQPLQMSSQNGWNKEQNQRVKNEQLIQHLISFNFESLTYVLPLLMGGLLMTGEEF